MTISQAGGDCRNATELAFSGQLVYSVSDRTRFAKLRGIHHGTRCANCASWCSKANSLVNRSIFMDVLVYSLASDRLYVQLMGAFGTDVADFSLVGGR
jgi:hypothetical protein